MNTRVSNMQSANGNTVANQFVITIYDESGETISSIFQSYRSNIVKIENGKTYLDERYWNYSKTTGKYRNLFLGETKAETQKKIDDGTYLLTNLN